ncbi:MAG: class I SAM-dependent methyltransferase [Acidimicrobiia bacterium]|nr:class I SAM-dependent methyltransferase [Acidimicrobiia bacterium]
MDRLLELTRLAEESHFWFRGFRRFVTPVLDRGAAGRTDLDILDCGCGTGVNLELLAPYGRAVGLDLTESGLHMARRAGRPLVRASVVHLPYRSESFDLVTSFDVLQSVQEDAAAMAEMARVLRPGGALVLTLAAFELLRGDHSVLAREVRRYSQSTTRGLLEGAGLEVVQIRYTFATTLPLVLGVRLARRWWRGGIEEDGAEITVPAAPVNLVLGALLAAEAAVTRHVPAPAGSSLVALARKPAG